MTFQVNDIVQVKKSGLWSTGKEGTVVNVFMMEFGVIPKANGKRDTVNMK